MLKEYLMSLKKNQLQDMIIFFGVQKRISLNKPELAEILDEYLRLQPCSWLFQLPERDMKLLLQLVKAGYGAGIDIACDEYPSVIEALSLVEASVEENGRYSIMLPEGLFDTVAQWASMVYNDNSANGTYAAQNEFAGYLNLYGIIPLEELIILIAGNHDKNGDAGAMEKRIAVMANNALVKLCQTVIDGKTYMYSPHLFNPEWVLEKRKQYKLQPGYKVYDMHDALTAGSDAPYSVFGMETDEGRKLTSMLSCLGYTDEEITGIAHNIWMDSQFATDEAGIETLFDSVSRKQDDLEDFDLYKGCIDAIAEYANSLPKWILKGSSANEENMCKIKIEVDDDGFNAAISQLDSMSRLFRYGMAVKHVRPNDPCPCGSGLSYRLCHGRHLS